MFDRDYKVLTEEERAQLDIAKEYYKKNTANGIITLEVTFKYQEMKPKATDYYESLFPNNFLNREVLLDRSYLKNIELEFVDLLSQEITERDILNFINTNRHYTLIASLFHSGFTFGHHGAYLFKEFELPTTYKADYLLIGKNSNGHHFIFIELENPKGSITVKKGDFGQTIRKGIKQVRSWDDWIEGNFHSLSLVFDKHKSPNIELPKEFRKLNKTRLNYIVIAGRRSDFNEQTYDEKRKLYRNENIQVLHYDNLIDSFKTLQNSDNY